MQKQKTKSNHESVRSPFYAWEHLLDTDSTCTDMDDAMTLNGPLYRTTTTRTAVWRSSIRTESSTMDEDDTTTESMWSRQQDARRVSLVGRFSGRVLLWGFLSVAAFATTNVILDTFHLRPQESQTQRNNGTTTILALSSRKGTTESQMQRFTVIRGVLLTVSTKESLSQLHTPQLKALDWIANRDPLQLEPDSNHLLQRYALAVLYFATSELGWKREMNWLSPLHECEWKADGGVRACDSNQYITDLSLWNNLKGILPVELGALTKLQVLYLARNQLHGTIPTELGQLTDLTYLGLQHNRLTGTFPSTSFGALTKLRTLYLEKNDLTGTIQRNDPLCQLRFDASPIIGQPHTGGVLRQVTSDCRQLVQWKAPEVTCGCCTKCFAA